MPETAAPTSALSGSNRSKAAWGHKGSRLSWSAKAYMHPTCPIVAMARIPQCHPSHPRRAGPLMSLRGWISAAANAAAALAAVAVASASAYWAGVDAAVAAASAASAATTFVFHAAKAASVAAGAACKLGQSDTPARYLWPSCAQWQAVWVACDTVILTASATPTLNSARKDRRDPALRRPGKGQPHRPQQRASHAQPNGGSGPETGRSHVG